MYVRANMWLRTIGKNIADKVLPRISCRCFHCSELNSLQRRLDLFLEKIFSLQSGRRMAFL